MAQVIPFFYADFDSVNNAYIAYQWTSIKSLLEFSFGVLSKLRKAQTTPTHRVDPYFNRTLKGRNNYKETRMRVSQRVPSQIFERIFRIHVSNADDPIDFNRNSGYLVKRRLRNAGYDK